MKTNNRQVYDCDTFSYWCNEEQYNDKDKKFGRFIDDDRAYEITAVNTPRPWLNYLCNDKVATAIANDGMGFLWYKSSLLRITKYDHPIDYLPREFKDGRDIIIEDKQSGEKYNLFKDYDDIKCIHSTARTTFKIAIGKLKVAMQIFVPIEDACECWIISIENDGDSKRELTVTMSQKWAIARFGIHTAEEGIPYLSTPGDKQTIKENKISVTAHTDNPDLPVEVWACFESPEAASVSTETEKETRKDGRVFEFVKANIHCDIDIKAGETSYIHAISGAEENEELFNKMQKKYENIDAYADELNKVKNKRNSIIESLKCQIPDDNMQKFLNIWLKHQLYLTFRFVRSGYIGYRDSLQDTWGYELVEPSLTKDRLLTILSHMESDGSCPRNFSPFGIDDSHDLRNFMDSATWIGMCLTDYIKETGDFEILNEKIRYLDNKNLDTVENHVWKAFDLLYKNRGLHGLNLIGDGDWNDGIEGISKQGPAVSVWLTMAVFHGQNLLADMYRQIGDSEKENILRSRSKELKDCINEHAWDGEWYVYAFSGKGNPIGSHINNEGKMHLNSNTWAVFTGIADKDRTKLVMESIKKHLDTPLGPALMHPPYVNDGDEVGRIARLEPGTFENGSVYKHAVTFKVFADIEAGNYETAFNTFSNILPTNPNNPDSRRTSEPYCLGNYYCGPTHERFGQNFFSWFTGSPAWLLRAGFDQMLGVKADYEGLRISPKVPASWNEFKVKRLYRGTLYNLDFKRVSDDNETGIWVDGVKIQGNLISNINKDKANVLIRFR